VSQCKASLTDENLAFSPDSSAFLDLASATASIEDLIAKIGHNDCGFHYEIVGYTTNFGSSEHQISLSLARAEAVAKLVREKYPQANVSVSGMGYDGTGGLSQSNRRVEVTVTK
jgi:outer membrane protein OmpA-like peptidoglycan-associated protein